MNKQQYLQKLNAALNRLDYTDRADRYRIEEIEQEIAHVRLNTDAEFAERDNTGVL